MAVSRGFLRSPETLLSPDYIFKRTLSRKQQRDESERSALPLLEVLHTTGTQDQSGGRIILINAQIKPRGSKLATLMLNEMSRQLSLRLFTTTPSSSGPEPQSGDVPPGPGPSKRPKIVSPNDADAGKFCSAGT